MKERGTDKGGNKIDDGEENKLEKSENDARSSFSQQPVAGAGKLIGLQILSRLITVLMAQLQIRLTSAEAFGAANIQLELVLGTILTFSREGIRNASSRQSTRYVDQHDDDYQNRGANNEKGLENIAILPIVIGIPISILVMTVYQSHFASEKLVNHPHFQLSCIIFLTGTLLELISEPLYIAALRKLQLGPRIWSEGAGLMAKGASTLACMIWLQKDESSNLVDLRHSLLPFGVGQFFYGLAFLTVFLLHSIMQAGVKGTLELYSFRFGKQGMTTLDQEAFKLSISMSRQNVVKHVLGEADKFAVARLGSLSDQGAYALASNYGSLVARLLYQPIEESARLTFARNLGSRTSNPSQAAILYAQNMLRTLLSFYVLLTMYLIAFCPPLTTPLLTIIAGQRWALETSAPKILAVYGAAYLPAMAFNGLLEGFLQASATPKQLTRYDAVLVGASGCFIAFLALMTSPWSPFLQDSRSLLSVPPEIALVLASTFSTYIRAIYCFRFATKFFSSTQQDSFSFQSILPKRLTASIFLGILAALYRHAYYLTQKDWRTPWSTLAINLIIMAVAFVILGMIECARNERKTIIEAVHAIRGKERVVKSFD